MPKIIKKTIKEKKPETKNELSGIGIYDFSGVKSGDIKVSEVIFGQKENRALVTQALRVYTTNIRQGTASTKTRGEVSGGGRKPWKEKGTGRARQGSTRAPHWRGGGVVFGPKPRDINLSLNDKMRKKALYVSLSEKLENNKIKAISIDPKKDYKTKETNLMFKKLFADKKIMKNILIIYTKENKNLVNSLRNLPYINFTDINLLNVLQVTRANQIVFTREAIKKYE